MLNTNHSELLSCYQEPTLDIWHLWRSQIVVTFIAIIGGVSSESVMGHYFEAQLFLRMLVTY